ncbi:MAG: T9SS type A sorting domain-containing protein [Flavobacteriales bacterium]|nr:T9SS type A sorting domain-containing protein [Flavobacteriales bacterium]
MRIAILFLFGGLSPVILAQNWKWATAFLGTGEMRIEAVTALDDDGALVCGEFNDTLRTGADTIVTHGDWDGFLARLDSSGAVLWLTAIGGANADELNDVTVDDAGNAYAAATFPDTADWNGTPIPGLGYNAVLVKFDLSGNVQWFSRATGGATFGYTAAENDGTIVFAGVINSSASFSGTTITNSTGIYNTFVARYNSATGTLIDVGTVSSSTGDYGPRGMDVDGDGNVYMTGYSRPSANPYVGSFMRKIAYGSGTNWAVTVSSSFNDINGRDVSVAPDGYSYFTGNIHDNVTWMGQSLGQFGRQRNAYLARFAPDGTLAWVQQYGSTNVDEGYGVVADGLGNAYWTGRFTGPVDFDTITVPGIGFISQDVFVARTEPAGGAAWVSVAGGSGLEEMGLAIDKQVGGPVIVGGQYASFQTSFGSTLLPPPYGQRCFVASMGAPDDALNTGVRAEAPASTLQLHPNPAQDMLFIALPGARGSLLCSVFDAAGREVLRTTLGAPFGTLDVASLAPGLYTLRCMDEHGTMTSQRLVVQH